MGAQRVLQALAVAAALAAALAAAPVAAQPALPTGPAGVAEGAAPAAPKPLRDRVAVIDLGPADAAGAVRGRLAAALVAAGLRPVIGEGVEDALAGVAGERDALELAAALAEAQRAFGALDCPAAVAASKRAAGIGAARQAAGLPVPELPRAWTYALLCADRAGDAAAAEVAAARLRAVGGSPDVPADVWQRYPEVDTVLDRDFFEVELGADVPGAAIWIDHRPAGTAPLVARLPAGEHVIAAAAGTRRGWVAGTPSRSQPRLTIPMPDQAGRWAELAARVASWRGEVPGPAELAWVLGHVRANVALVRRGDQVEAWGRPGFAGPPQRLGGDDGRAPLADAERVIALVADRTRTWRDRAPDPDRPLLVEDPGERDRDRARGTDRRDAPTRWWVYAAIAGAVAASAAVVLVNETAPDRQRVELRFP